MMPICRLLLTLCAALLLVSGTAARADSPAELLAAIKAVKAQGEGHAAAIRAHQELIRQDVDVLPALLAALDDADPLAANWIRSAFEAIADRAVKSGRSLPANEFEAFIRNVQHNPRARRLAYEWLLQMDPEARERLIPGMLLDPSPEFRRDAVARLIDQALRHQAANEREEAARLFRQALSGAVDDDQVKAIVRPLAEFGQRVDLQKHFGFLTRWQIVGPFDNRDKKGFAVVYPPEQGVDLMAKYAGQLGECTWKPIATRDDYGILNIAEQIAPYKGAVMYAVTDFDSTQQQRVELRLGTPNAWKLWLNGRLLFAREEYHRGMALDQYRVPAELQPGRNEILLKLCQNEQEEDWAQRYQFQLRVCDAAGSAVLPRPAVTTSRLDSP